MTIDLGDLLYPDSVYPDPIREGPLADMLDPDFQT